jgi:hypothetical protein
MPESIKSDNLSIKDIRKMINSNVTKEDEGNRFEVKWIN